MKMFDMSCYDPKFKYYRPGKYEMGLMKDESPMSPIIEAVTLKDKLYGYKRESDQVKCKGIKNEIDFESLKRALFHNEILTAEFNKIANKDMKIYSYKCKQSLIAYSDKRYLFNEIMSYAYGHYMIN